MNVDTVSTHSAAGQRTPRFLEPQVKNLEFQRLTLARPLPKTDEYE
jgi:hypothetical protein